MKQMKDLVCPWLNVEKEHLNCFSQEYLIEAFCVDGQGHCIYIVFHKNVNGCYEYELTCFEESSIVSFVIGLRRNKKTYEIL